MPTILFFCHPEKNGGHTNAFADPTFFRHMLEIHKEVKT
jgi:hypothetical protein